MTLFTDDGTVSGIMEKRGIFDVSDQKVLVATCVATNYYPKPSIKFLISKFKFYKI